MRRARRAPRTNRLAPGINLTPMLDMIFNLLFFFVLATNVRVETGKMDVRLPEARSARNPPGREPAPSLTLSSEGEVYFKDRPMAREELTRELGALARQGQREISIRGDKRVDYGRVVEVMDWCKLAGIKSVLLELGKPGSPAAAAPAQSPTE